MEDGAVGVRGPAAVRGTDNRAVLRELGGYSDAELDALEAAGALIPPA
jgi:crotonobetainyl-CoA:carnitine CoA-transferase CaiB-like acyl-CoA transferase